MKYEEIIKMAHQTSKEWAKEYPTPEETAHPVPKRFLEIFAKLVAEKEREACAKIFDDAKGTGRIASCREAADAIRARGQE